MVKEELKRIRKCVVNIEEKRIEIGPKIDIVTIPPSILQVFQT
jgi:hypothetical protein